MREVGKDGEIWEESGKGLRGRGEDEHRGGGRKGWTEIQEPRNEGTRRRLCEL